MYIGNGRLDEKNDRDKIRRWKTTTGCAGELMCCIVSSCQRMDAGVVPFIVTQLLHMMMEEGIQLLS